MTTTTVELLTFAGTVLVSLGVVKIVRRWTEHRRLYDRPSERSSHTKPTPRLGGIGIVVGVIAGLILMLSCGAIKESKPLVIVLAAALLIAAISLADDLRSLSAAARFPVHLAAAILVVVTVGYWHTVAIGSFLIDLGILAVPFTCFWLVGVTNVYNFMDGIDGIASVQAIVAGTGWVVIGSRVHLPAIWILGGLIAAATAGFLIENWPPARIFMGDVGSAFLGFLLAVIPLLSSAERASLFVPAALMLWPFLFDSSFTLLRRLRRHENIFAAHRSHLYQRLNLSGRSHRFVTLLYAALALLGMAAVTTGGLVATSTVVLAAVALWLFVVHEERVAVASRNTASTL